MRVRLLGPVEVEGAGGERYGPGGGRPRALLARLALSAGAVVPAGSLAEALWGEQAPGPNALHTVVSRLRRTLAEAAGDAPVPLESSAAGYRLRVTAADVDALHAERLAGAARTALTAGDPVTAAERADEALATWRGDPLADVDDAPFAAAAAARLDELRLHLHELRVEAGLAGGGRLDLPALEARARAYPLREHLQTLLVRALYAAGRQADALEAYERTRAALADELGVDPSAELAAAHVAVLRHDDTALRVTAATAATAATAGPGERAATATAPARRSNVRAQLTSFVGREQDVDRVAALLDAGRLVTLVGAGGSGKTRLALETAATFTDRAPDGTWVAELASVHDPLDLPAAVLTAIGRQEQTLLARRAEVRAVATSDDVLARLVDTLAGADLLVVLDNCEHLIGAAAQLADTLLASCPRVRVLATSREPLGITGETLCPVGPLPVPAQDADPAAVRAAPAVRLLTDRAAAVRPGFAVDDANAAAVGQICRRLDGLPLAIELAAARLRAMSPQQVADRLDDRFRLLTGGSRTALPRHRTLEAVVDWSWELLEKPERLLLQRLAVFAGPVGLDVVEQVVADDELPAADVLDLLASLVDKSLVDAIGGAGAATGAADEVRYRLLETVRAYAGDRLADAGAEQMRERHARYLLAVVEAADEQMRGPDQLTHLARLDALRDDLVAAQRWSTDGGHGVIAARLLVGLAWYWAVRGQQVEMQQWPPRVLPLLDDDVPAWVRAVVRGFAAAGALDPTRPDAGGPIELPPVAELMAAAVADARAADDPYRHPVLAVLEPLDLVLTDRDAGLAALARVGEAHPDPWTRALVLLAHGHLLEHLSGGSEAVNGLTGERFAAMQVQDFERALELFTASGDRWGRALTLSSLAERAELQGDYERALAFAELSLRLLQELQTTDDIAVTLARMASTYARAGRPERAAALLAGARERGTALGSSWEHAILDLAAHELAFRRGDLAAARRHLDDTAAAVDRVVRKPPPQFAAMLAAGYATLDVAGGRLDDALERLRGVGTAPLTGTDTPVLGAVSEQWAEWLLAAASAAPRPAAAAVEPPDAQRERAAALLGCTATTRGSRFSATPGLADRAAAARAALGADRWDAAYDATYALSRGAAIARATELVAPYLPEERRPEKNDTDPSG